MAATDYLNIDPSLEEQGGRPSRTNGATTGQQLTTVGTTTVPAALPTHEPPSGLWRWNKDDATNNNTRISPFSPRRRQWSVALFAVTTVLLFADQNLMAPNLTAIARTFAMTDAERDQKLAGDIALAFFVLGAPASLVVGCLGDDPRYNRAHLFGLTVGLGEGACLLTYFCQTYRQLYLCRAVTGLALGGALPLLYSVLGDLYSARDRHVVNAVVGMGTGVGISLGQGVAGLVGPTWGWRLPFVLISVPALVCAALVVGTVDDPPRGGMEEAVLHEQQHQSHVEGSDEDSDISPRVEMMPLHQDDDSLPRSHSTTHYMDSDALAQQQATHDESRKDSPTMLNAVSDRHSRRHNIWMHWKTFVSLIKTPTVILCLLQGAPGCVPWGIVNSFLNDFLSENRGMSVETATMVILVFGVGNFCGLVLGGGLGSYLYTRDQRYPPLLAGSMAMASCFPFWTLLNGVNKNSSFLFVVVVALLSGTLSGGTGPVVKASLQNVTLPDARGQAFALFNTFDDFGRGLGPVYIAWLIVNFGGRTRAFNFGVWGWMLCGLINVAMFTTIRSDERRVQQILTASMSVERHRTNSFE